MLAFDVGILGLDKAADGVLVTFMFKRLGGGDRPALNKMIDEVERVYSTFITRVVRKPNSVAQKASRPILIAVPDRPVFKNEKQELRDVKANDGVHMHGILMVPGRSRLKEGVETHFKTHENRYVRNNLVKCSADPIQPGRSGRLCVQIGQEQAIQLR